MTRFDQIILGLTLLKEESEDCSVDAAEGCIWVQMQSGANIDRVIHGILEERYGWRYIKAYNSWRYDT